MDSSLISPETKCWAALASMRGVGRRTLWSLKNQLEKTQISIEEFWASKSYKLSLFDIHNNIIESIKLFKKEHNCESYFDMLSKKNIRVICAWQKEFPTSLCAMDDTPFLIYVKGPLSYWNQQFIAVVGSRNMTPYGKYAASTVTAQLVSLGFGIVSGCMYGIDQVAHEAAIKQSGFTIGVLGYGFDHAYPRSIITLQQEILKSGGALLSEYAPEVSPNKGTFAERNRIVAGLARGVVVVEAASKSGSLITAQCALDQGSSVFAVPGPFFSPYSDGTKWLINQGAVVVTGGNDVLTELQQSEGDHTILGESNAERASIVRLYNFIRDLLASGGLDGERITQKVLLSSEWNVLTAIEINRALTELELSGSIMRSGFWYELRDGSTRS